MYVKKEKNHYVIEDWDHSLFDWLESNCTSYHLLPTEPTMNIAELYNLSLWISFDNPEDEVLFKLTWI